jgi:hypothetical protein
MFTSDQLKKGSSSESDSGDSEEEVTIEIDDKKKIQQSTLPAPSNETETPAPSILTNDSNSAKPPAKSSWFIPDKFVSKNTENKEEVKTIDTEEKQELGEEDENEVDEISEGGSEGEEEESDGIGEDENGKEEIENGEEIFTEKSSNFPDVTKLIQEQPKQNLPRKFFASVTRPADVEESRKDLPIGWKKMSIKIFFEQNFFSQSWKNSSLWNT